MPRCVVKGCKNYNVKTKGSTIQYFSFPKNFNVCNRWIEACQCEKLNLTNARICSMHFSKDSYIESYLIKSTYDYPTTRRSYLKPDAVPTELLPLLNQNASTSSISAVNPPIVKEEIYAGDTSSDEEMLQTNTSAANSPILKEEIYAGDTSSDEEMLQTRELSESIVVEASDECSEGQTEQLLRGNRSLLKRIEELEKENGELNSILNRYFTPGQLRILKTEKTKVRWSADDISSAISLRSVSPKAYRYLRNVRKHPLPALSTLRKWASALALEPGILDEVLAIMKQKAVEFHDVERLSVISFDEIYISHKMCMDKKNERVLGPHKAAQTIMVRSLFGRWKQVVYYDFDVAMTADTLLTVISKLQLANYTVVAVVSDLGPRNLSLWNIDWHYSAEIVGIFNNWFDLFNSQQKFGTKCHAFGHDIECQLRILEEMSTCIKNIRVGKHLNLLPFQKGILLNNKSLLGLFYEMQEKFDITYLLTYRLNQDILENFFSYIRGMGGNNDLPSPIDFKYMLRWYIIGKHSSAVFTENRNIEGNSEESDIVDISETKDCFITETLKAFCQDIDITEENDEEAILNINTFEDVCIDDEHLRLLEDFEEQTQILETQEIINNEGLKYIAGYVAYTYKNIHPLCANNEELSAPSKYDWIGCISKGHLLYPNEELMELGRNIMKQFTINITW